MNSYTLEELKANVDALIQVLGIELDTELLRSYLSGELPGFLDQTSDNTLNILIIQKYLVGTHAFIRQPSTYYEIYAANRCVDLIRILSNALIRKIRHIAGIDNALHRLKQTKDQEQFDSLVFEILVCLKYDSLPNVAAVEMLPQRSEISPDMKVTLDSGDFFYVECKKLNRHSGATLNAQQEIDRMLSTTARFFKKLRISIAGELILREQPDHISTAYIFDLFQRTVAGEQTDPNEPGALKIQYLPLHDWKGQVLYPSPLCDSRYGYHLDGNWNGIYRDIQAQFLSVEPWSSERTKASSWLEDATWDFAVKWKIENPTTLWKQKKIGLASIFHAIKQVADHPSESIIHVWIERHLTLGHRQIELHKALYKLARSPGNKFGRLIFNETIHEVSKKGYFSFVEHSHPVTHLSNISAPLVSNIFIDDEDVVSSSGAFGVGAELPDIDLSRP